MTKFTTSLFIFRRDLRLEDNTGLIAALNASEEVLPCFIFDPRQVDETLNSYRSLNCIQFMIKSLHEVHEALLKKNSQLYLFFGNPSEVLESVLKTYSINGVFVNGDYTPFSIQRDIELAKICHHYKVSWNCHHDALLNKPNIIKTTQGKPYSVFTPFFKAAAKLEIAKPVYHVPTNFTKMPNIALKSAITFPEVYKKEWGGYFNNDLFRKGGRAEALAILKKIKNFTDYNATRNLPSISTTGLSPHNKFGTVSIREVYEIFKNNISNTTLIQQLYWRDFFTHIGYHFPHVFGGAFHEKFDKLAWNTRKEDFEKWCTGTTGFPIVDAGMRQLNRTGFMHNRVRLIVASFLTKDLHINWLWGEKYFAQTLVDYDPSVNNGNWQWCASTGCDSQPYFRIFNPWLQQKKFDPECIYIKEWVPELREVDSKIIHSRSNATNALNNYPAPMLDHKKESVLSKLYYKNVT